ncbi:MAG: Crp/Fnr family transcriptional regulator [Rhodoferax sp.]|jgi:CRP-like cAMP-binding protein|uniref:Crp/Fnr family transcriptional regulator n=1 Tax=Rhodoferax sp. TaxID=50421 RepID=UPI001B4A4B1E|nr:Crp/Fnr family transcriptional regulator [Rhodoferax sp.]MBP8286994.1 Crp/Fnr family transcriptional regulator [Rhodoferax sp.]MBP9148962.1 Crp/Fnr family transcriptional regulator [Rhodoferax sp.]MBP9735870.1 Crp/Fnr family transcriptional regulator [Rhodoferax sp.]
MSTVTRDTTCLHLEPREVLAPDAPQQLWRVATGALRIDSAPPDEASRFVRLALPGDVIGVEQWAGTNDHLSLRALIDTSLTPVEATGPQMMHILMETVVVAHQRCREVVTLRSGPVAQRIKALLLMFAQGRRAGNGSVADCPVPYLADLSDLVDAAPETVSRVLGSMREHDFLQDRKPQKARFSSQALKGLEMVAGMSAVRPARKLRSVLA